PTHSRGVEPRADHLPERACTDRRDERGRDPERDSGRSGVRGRSAEVDVEAERGDLLVRSGQAFDHLGHVERRQAAAHEHAHQPPPPPPPPPPPEKPPPLEKPDPPLDPGVGAENDVVAVEENDEIAFEKLPPEAHSAPCSAPEPTYQEGSGTEAPCAARSSKTFAQRVASPKAIAYGR